MASSRAKMLLSAARREAKAKTPLARVTPEDIKKIFDLMHSDPLKPPSHATPIGTSKKNKAGSRTKDPSNSSVDTGRSLPK